jgi:hypothetical protein
MTIILASNMHSQYRRILVGKLELHIQIIQSFLFLLKRHRHLEPQTLLIAKDEPYLQYFYLLLSVTHPAIKFRECVDALLVLYNRSRGKTRMRDSAN